VATGQTPKSTNAALPPHPRGAHSGDAQRRLSGRRAVRAVGSRWSLGVPGEVKGTKTTIRSLNWQFAVTFGHHPPWLSHSSTSVCVESSASSLLPGEASRIGTSRSWCSATRSGFSNVSCTNDCAIAPWTGRSLLHSAACSLEAGGGRPWLLLTRCCGGIGKRPSTSGADGGNNEALAGHR